MDDDGSTTHSSLFSDLSTEQVTSKIILTAIIVLFIAVLFILILHLYAKLYWWQIDQQQQEEDQQRRRFIFVPEQQQEEASSLSNNGLGLTPFELTSLPIVFPKEDGFESECAICLSEFVKGDKSRLLPNCNHCFHLDCIDIWFHSHSTCPICRNTVVIGLDQVSSKRVEQVVVLDNGDDNINNHDALSRVPSPSLEFPTNVLVWGRQDHVSTGNTNVGYQDDGVAVVLDINDSNIRTQNAEEEESKSPMTTRLRSLRRFLSRDKRVACSNSSSSSSSNAAAASTGS